MKPEKVRNLTNLFFEQPVLNSPYECPSRHWELDEKGQPTQKIIESRRQAEFITPIPKPKKRKESSEEQAAIVFDEGKGLSTEKQQYEHTAIINGMLDKAGTGGSGTGANREVSGERGHALG